jgi:hypothetical protein
VKRSRESRHAAAARARAEDAAWVQRHYLKVVLGVLVGAILAWFAGKETDACEARGGKQVERGLITRCEYPDEPAPPALDTTPPSVLQSRTPATAP